MLGKEVSADPQLPSTELTRYQSLANYELRLALSRLLWDFELNESCENWMDQETYSFWLKPPLMVKAQTAKPKA